MRGINPVFYLYFTKKIMELLKKVDKTDRPFDTRGHIALVEFHVIV
jgi:hypothetical protein